MTKKEKIQESYGEHWKTVKDYIDEDGFINCVKNKKLSLIPHFDISEIDFKGNLVRPKSIQGIEKNNGWIKIESEDDLPEERTICLVIFKNIPEHISCQFFIKLNSLLWINHISHYQLIQNPKLPIY